MRRRRFHDPEEAQDVLQAFSSEALRIRPAPRAAAPFRLAMAHVGLPTVKLFLVDAASLQVVHPECNDFLSVTLPAGSPFAVAGSPLGLRQANVLFPRRPFELRAQPLKCAVTNVPAQRLRRYCEVSGGTLSMPPEATRNVDLGRRRWGAYERLVHFLCAEARRESSALRSPLIRAELEDALLFALAEALASPETAPSERHRPALEAAKEYARANLLDPLSREELAGIAGTSIRTLTRWFLEEHAVGPMAWVRRERLHRARAELQRGDAGTTSVTEICLRHGFASPSTFSRLYRAEFGELPSETLRAG